MAQPGLGNQEANPAGTECVAQMRCATGRQTWRSEGDGLPECCPSAGAGFGESHQEGCPAGVGSSSCSDSGLEVVQSLGHQSWGMGGEESREQSGLEPQLCGPVTGSQGVGGLAQSIPIMLRSGQRYRRILLGEGNGIPRGRRPGQEQWGPLCLLSQLCFP